MRLHYRVRIYRFGIMWAVHSAHSVKQIDVISDPYNADEYVSVLYVCFQHWELIQTLQILQFLINVSALQGLQFLINVSALQGL